MESFEKLVGRLEILTPVAEITKALKIISSGLCVNQNTVLFGDSEFWLPEWS